MDSILVGQVIGLSLITIALVALANVFWLRPSVKSETRDPYLEPPDASREGQEHRPYD